MTVPTTYSDWVTVLEHFGNGDDTVLTAINEGHFVLDAGTAQRFYTRVEEVYKKRKQNWLDKFQRSFQMQNIKTDDDFGIALRNGKQNLLPLSKFILSKGLPEDLRKALQKDLDDFVAEIKKSLKDNVSKTGNGREKMLVILNTFGLPEIQQEEQVPTASGNNLNEENNIISPTIRKIIF
ncbi:hypothetical protein [Flavobacterium sp. UBA4197]|uniref:hypothetical protein n=1 Tax=Flavobacterium sp. UBA4197 TaxID=1946546 RepID=UPI002580AE2E|nr:hypothetical protein [Flavobacterium sp. UBA4197]